MGAPCVALNLTRLSSSAILTFFLLISAASGSAQDNFADVQLAEKARQLFTEQRWQEVVALVGPARAHPRTSISSTDRLLLNWAAWPTQGRPLRRDHGCSPTTSGFRRSWLGVAFKQKDYPRAARYLRRALHLDPHDAYGNDFLGTVYFLQGNIEAALKSWNRVNKPAVAEVRTVPIPG